MPRYVYDPELDRMIERKSGLPMLSQEERSRPLQAPKVYGDLPGYQSPVTGEWVDGRRARAYDMAKHNCIPAQDLKPYGYEGRKFKNRKFAEKRGLTDLLHDGAKEQKEN